MKFSVHVIIDTSASPALQQAVTALLTALRQEPRFVVTEGQASGFVGLEEIIAFTGQEAVNPNNTKKVRADAKRFYQNLLVWTVRNHVLPLRFVYGGCQKEDDQCGDGNHRHEIFMEDLPYWKLSITSVLELEEAQIGRVHRLTAERLRRFIEYLKLLPR